MNIDDLDTMLVQALDMENGGLFLQGDCIVTGIESGLSRKLVYGRFAYLSRRGLRTAKQRHKVSAIFTPDRRDDALNWSFHSLCASAADLRKPETWTAAYQWLERAGGLIADDREYSVEDLANDMKASGLNPNAEKPIYIADKDSAILISADTNTREITLKFEDLEPFKKITTGMVWDNVPFIVTIVQKTMQLESL